VSEEPENFTDAIKVKVEPARIISEVPDDIQPSYKRYKKNFMATHNQEVTDTGQTVILSRQEKELETIENLRIAILKTRAEMWKYYVSAITHTSCSDFELYKFLCKDSPYVKQLKQLKNFVYERDLSCVQYLFTAEELAHSNFRPLISSL
jgi:hypothetical protein